MAGGQSSASLGVFLLIAHHVRMSMKSLTLKAGPRARQLIEQQGFSPGLVSHLGAAAGGPKWLVLNRLDRALFGEWFRGRREPMIAVGSSIGTWRLACAAQRDPLAAIDRFEAAYIEQRYGPKPSPQEVSEEARRILRKILGESGEREILEHPWLKLNIVTVRCRGWTGSDVAVLQKAALLGAALANTAHRSLLGGFMERAVVHPADFAARYRPDGFRTRFVPLDEQNLFHALMASAAIPMALAPVRDLPGATPGAYLDGGMIDYHMDLPLEAPSGIVFLPHFSEKVTTGWLDKFLPWRKARHLDHTLLVAPSREFLATLPNGKIPDRHDFWTYAGRDEERMRDWKIAVDAGQRLADEFMELSAKGKWLERLETL
jgi:hypothetical protein